MHCMPQQATVFPSRGKGSHRQDDGGDWDRALKQTAEHCARRQTDQKTLLRRSAAHRSSCAGGVHQVFQFLAGLEKGDFLRWDLDLVACLGIAADARLTLARAEAAEAANLDFVAAMQRAHNAAEDSFDNHLAVFAR